MKLSQFNSTLPYLGNFILYNSFSDYFIIVQPLLKELLYAAHYEDNLSKLKDYHPAFFKELQDHGFILEHDVDEADKVRKLAARVDGDLSVYTLTINPTMACNFKCWYCYESHIRASKMSVSVINKILKFINNEKTLNRHLKFFNLSFFGGEPLLYYEQTIVPLLEGASKIFKDSGVFFRAGFTSNGLLLDQNKIEFFKRNSVDNFQITLDGNREFHDKVRYVNSSKGSYERIISNIKLLARKEIRVIMRINFTQENFLSCMEIPIDFADLETPFKDYINVDLHQVWQDTPISVSSLSPVIDSFVNAGFSVAVEATSLNNVVDSCYADKHNSSTINYNGEVFKCTARDFTEANSLGIIDEDGTIKWNDEYKLRQNAKFKNPPCLECRLLPICNGGCSQHAYENLGSENGYCVFNFNENKKDELILERFRLRTT